MRPGAALIGLLLMAAPGGAAPSRRVMSLNLCTDQLVLALLPPQRIASVTWLSRDPAQSLMAARAAHVATNHGQAEEVLRQHPDLVIADSFTTPATRAMLKRVGYPLIEIDSAESFDGIRRATRQVAAAVGKTGRGEALLARMDRQLAALAALPIRPIRVAAWDSAGFSARPGSLYDQVLTTAGAHNVAGEAGHYGVLDAEVLLTLAPSLLVQATPGSRSPGLRTNAAWHPEVRTRWAARTLFIRPAYYACGTPFTADAAAMLHNDLRRAGG